MITRADRVRGFGWVPDHPDRRDLRLALKPKAELPSAVDLRAACPPVYDQGDLGSCTANAIAAALEFDRKKQKIADFMPSRLFIYYNERAMEHTVNEDAGAQIRDGIKSVSHQGAPPETSWPYDISRYTVKPPASVYRTAKDHLAVIYRRLSAIDARNCLAAGFPFVFGFTVYESFASDVVAKTGVMPMPRPHEGNLGGHAVMAVGYDDSVKRYLVRNSWGTDWGQDGYFWMPYQYLEDDNLSDDFWTIRLVK